MKANPGQARQASPSSTPGPRGQKWLYVLSGPRSVLPNRSQNSSRARGLRQASEALSPRWEVGRLREGLGTWHPVPELLLGKEVGAPGPQRWAGPGQKAPRGLLLCSQKAGLTSCLMAGTGGPLPKVTAGSSVSALPLRAQEWPVWPGARGQGPLSCPELVWESVLTWRRCGPPRPLPQLGLLLVCALT